MISLILSALEAPRAGVSALTFQELEPRTRVRLLRKKLIRLEGYERVGRSADDETLVSLSWSAEHGGYGHFDPTRGWITAAPEEIGSYTLDFRSLLKALTQRLEIGSGAPQALVGDHLWLIGRARLGPQDRSTPIYFARRLHDLDVAKAVRTALDARPMEHRYPVLTSTKAAGLPIAPHNGEYISLHDVLSDGLALNRAVVSSRLYRLPAIDNSEPLVILADGKQVIFFGKTYKFPKGPQQRRIIQYLAVHTTRANRWISADRVITDLNLPMTARVRDYFHKHACWGQLLTVSDGMCGFCWPDEK